MQIARFNSFFPFAATGGKILVPPFKPLFSLLKSRPLPKLLSPRGHRAVSLEGEAKRRRMNEGRLALIGNEIELLLFSIPVRRYFFLAPHSCFVTFLSQEHSVRQRAGRHPRKHPQADRRGKARPRVRELALRFKGGQGKGELGGTG